MALPNEIQNGDPADADAVQENFDWLYDRLTGAVTGSIPYASLDLDGSVDSADLAANSVGTSEIQDDAVTLAKIPRPTISTDTASSTSIVPNTWNNIGCSLSLSAGVYLVTGKLEISATNGPATFDMQALLRQAGVSVENYPDAKSIGSGTHTCSITIPLTPLTLNSTQTVDLQAQTDSLFTAATTGSFIRAIPIAA